MHYIKEYIKKRDELLPFFLYLHNLIHRLFYKFLDKEKIIRADFQKRMGRPLDLTDPVLFSDKLQWLKLNWYDERAVILADKIAVRDFVKHKIGSEYLNEIYGSYNSFKDISFDSLPESFVIKCNHGSGMNIFVKDRFKANNKAILNKLRWWLKIDYSFKGLQWVYKGIQPKILIEKYLEDGNPTDYKVWCFNGVPKIIQIDFDRFSNHVQNFYDLDLNFLDYKISFPNDPMNNVEYLEEFKEELIRLSAVLSENIPFSRIDFYIVDLKIIFGEITFFHQNGTQPFLDKEFELILGNMLDINKGEVK